MGPLPRKTWVQDCVVDLDGFAAETAAKQVSLVTSAAAFDVSGACLRHLVDAGSVDKLGKLAEKAQQIVSIPQRASVLGLEEK